MSQEKKDIIVPKEDAVFWMDENGRWHNQHGPFQHPKVVSHFNASIRKDKDGYHLYQEHDNVREKVYFAYAETPLFVFDVIKKDEILLILNTKKQVSLNPENLFMKNDRLFMRFDGEIIKFTEQVLVKLMDHIDEEDPDPAARRRLTHRPSRRRTVLRLVCGVPRLEMLHLHPRRQG